MNYDGLQNALLAQFDTSETSMWKWINDNAGITTLDNRTRKNYEKLLMCSVGQISPNFAVYYFVSF